MMQLGLTGVPQREATIGEARAMLRDGLDEGTECPCCDRYARRYKRKFNSGMARTLIWLVQYYEANGREWVHMARVAPRFVMATREIGTIGHWRLVEQKPNDDTKKKTSGVWRPTAKGIEFAKNATKIPSHVYLYNNILNGFADERFGIADALGSDFDYSELMDGEHWPPNRA